MISSYFCKKARLGILWLLLALCICACSGENKTASGITEDQGLANKEITVAGVSQKGPFLSGSTVQLYELDADLAQTGNNFVGKILSDKGDFSFNKIRLESDYVYLAATGYFSFAMAAMNSLPFEERCITGLTMGITRKNYLRLVAEINNFKRKISSIVLDEKNNAEYVYRMNLHLFPLTKKLK